MLVIDRVLIVGLGSIGKRHLNIIHSLLPNATVAVLRHDSCNKDTESLYIDDCFTSIEQALIFSPQIAIIANPATYHLSIAKPLAYAGVHLLIEKPLAANLDGVSSLLDVCTSSGSVLMVGYNLRFLPSFQFFKEKIRESIIGKALSVRAEVGQNLECWREGDYRTSVSAQKSLGGGALLELSHEVDYLLDLFGEVDWVSSALLKLSDLDINVEDTVHMLLAFKCSKGSNQSPVASVSVDFIRHDAIRQCIVIGEEGTLKWDASAGNVAFYDNNKRSWRSIFSQKVDRNYSYECQLKHFIECIESDKEVMVNGNDGLRVLEVVDAVRVSSSLEQRIFLSNLQSSAS